MTIKVSAVGQVFPTLLILFLLIFVSCASPPPPENIITPKTEPVDISQVNLKLMLLSPADLPPRFKFRYLTVGEQEIPSGTPWSTVFNNDDYVAVATVAYESDVIFLLLAECNIFLTRSPDFARNAVSSGQIPEVTRDEKGVSVAPPKSLEDISGYEVTCPEIGDIIRAWHYAVEVGGLWCNIHRVILSQGPFLIEVQTQHVDGLPLQFTITERFELATTIVEHIDSELQSPSGPTLLDSLSAGW